MPLLDHLLPTKSAISTSSAPMHYKSPRAQSTPHPVPQLDQAKMKLLLVLAAVAVALASGSSDKCRKQTFSGTQCAYLFDDDGCEGWKLPISTGYTELKWRHKNDAESVVVRPGCVFKGQILE